MKTLKIKGFYLGSVVIVFFVLSCEKESDPKPNKFEGTWKLVSLVNISSQESYLNAELVLGGDNHYKLYSNTGRLDGEGHWHYKNDSLHLEIALFETSGLGRYGIHNFQGNAFTLKEHYTKDNKDAILEFGFEKK